MTQKSFIQGKLRKAAVVTVRDSVFRNERPILFFFYFVSIPEAVIMRALKTKVITIIIKIFCYLARDLLLFTAVTPFRLGNKGATKLSHKSRSHLLDNKIGFCKTCVE